MPDDYQFTIKLILRRLEFQLFFLWRQKIVPKRKRPEIDIQEKKEDTVRDIKLIRKEK